MYRVPLALKKDVEMGMGKREERIQEERRNWRLPGLLSAAYLLLCDKLKEDLRAMFCRGV